MSLLLAWAWLGPTASLLAGCFIGKWLQRRYGGDEAERVREKAVEYIFRREGWGIAQLAMLYADLGGKGGDTRGAR